VRLSHQVELIAQQRPTAYDGDETHRRSIGFAGAHARVLDQLHHQQSVTSTYGAADNLGTAV
jgi:hypothetical protein